MIHLSLELIHNHMHFLQLDHLYSLIRTALYRLKLDTILGQDYKHRPSDRNCTLKLAQEQHILEFHTA